MSFGVNDISEIYTLVCKDVKLNGALHEVETYAIDTSGKSGASGEIGADANGIYKTAGCGTNGSRGGDGTSIECFLFAPPGNCNFYVTQGLGSGTKSLPLLNSKSSIRLFSFGGRGGDGGSGGCGCRGSPGKKGADASSMNSGTSGGDGSPGGDGGKGGNGSDGGNGGDIVVNTTIDDVDLLLCIDEVNLKGGLGGDGGRGGPGGLGGPGGEGGSSYSWTTSETNSDGSTSTTFHSNPGGSRGANGPKGRTGTSGRSGAKGMPGQYIIRVHDMETHTFSEYNRVYQLFPRHTSCVDASDLGGNIEPGQVVTLQSVVIYNSGGMPSPAKSPTNDGVCIEVADNHLVSMLPGEAVVLPTAIAAGCDYQLPKGIKCIVKRTSIQPIANAPPLQYEVEFLLSAHSTRLQRTLPNFSRLPVTVTVRYPVQITAVRGGRTGLAGDSIPIAVCIQNIANIELGSAALRPRLVQVRIELASLDSIANPAGVLFRTGGCAVDQTYTLGCGPVIFDIPNFAANTTELLGGTILCTAGSLDAYRSVQVLVSLQLGDVDAPTDEAKLFVAQRATHTFQLVEECSGYATSTCVNRTEEVNDGLGSVPSAPFVSTGNNLLLVTNTSTGRDEVNLWKQFAAAVHMNLAVYDAAYYNGFGYSMEVANVLQDVRDGVVILLNYAYYRHDDNKYYNDSFYVDQFLRTSVIFEAARRFSVRTYVINSNPSLTMRQLVYPSEPHGPSIHHSSSTAFIKTNADAPYLEYSECLDPVYDEVSMSTKRVFLSPKEKDLEDRSDKLEAELSKVRPDRSYVTIKRYENEKVSRSFLFITKYRLGSVECRRGLDLTSALIGMWDLSVGPGDAYSHYFAVLKLLPFAKKLELLCGAGVIENDTVGVALVDATLSDIADEVSIYVMHKREYLFSGIPSSQMSQCMLRLALFTTYDRFPATLRTTLLLMCKRLDTLFQRICTKWGLTHPYARHLTSSLHRMVARLVPEVAPAKSLAKLCEVNAKPVDKTLGLRATLNAMRNPLAVGVLTFNNSVALENDPPVLAVGGVVSSGQPMFKFTTEEDRVKGVADFMQVAGMVSTCKGIVDHRGTL